MAGDKDGWYQYQVYALETLLLPTNGQERDKLLLTTSIRLRFYGFYLIACEDIGMRPQLLPDEPLDQELAQTAALKWLQELEQNPDLACDTRVAVPISVERQAGKTRIWATLGVRLARLEAAYARPPKVRPKEQGGPWQEVEYSQLATSPYLIPVEEFAEIELTGLRTLNRKELRAACDRYKTKEAIVTALAGDR